MAVPILNRLHFRLIQNNRFSFGWILLIYFIISLLLRATSLVYLYASPDEATYFIAGKALFSGKVFIRDLWDFKPIGIFVIAGIVAKTISAPLLVYRIIGILFVTFSGFIVYKIKLRFSSGQISFVTGMIYIILASLLASGVQTNTELFFNLFTIASLYFLTLNKSWSLVLSGLVFGIGFLIKYVVAFDYFIFILFFVILNSFVQRKSIKEKVYVCALIFSGFLIPIGVMCIYFISNNAWADYLYSLFQTKKAYTDDLSFTRELAFIGDFFLSYFPFILSFLLFMILFFKRQNKIAVFILCWFIATWIPIIIQGKHFTHYYIQALLPLSFVSAEILFIKNSGLKRIGLYKKAIGITFIILLIYSSYEQIRIANSNRKITYVIEYMKGIIKPKDTILSSDNRVYFELKRFPLSRYIHSSILFNQEHINASGINIDVEYAKIFSHHPSYIILSKDKVNSTIQPYLFSEYILLDEIQKFRIYQYKNNLNVSY